MPLIYTAAVPVAVGDPVSAQDMAGLAAAINSRVLGGPGDCHWRIPYSFFTLFRQLRNPDALGNFPPQAEFFHLYQVLNPELVDYPLAPAGEPEGGNAANPLVAFAAGSEALNLAAEWDRLGDIPTDVAGRDPDAPWTAAQLWAIGIAQRGAVDPRTGLRAAPMMDLAQSVTRVRSNVSSPYGNTYGGYHPGPTDAGGCATIGDLVPPNYQVFFTHLTTGTVRTYDGTCPDQATHIAGIAYEPLAYYVFLNNGQVDYLPKAQWIEGPYVGNAELRKAESGMLSRVLVSFASEFKGTAEQQQAADGGVSEAFQLEDFLTRQYPLAPQLGREVAPDRVEALYPEFQLSGTAGELKASGTALRDRRSGLRFRTPAGFVTTHLWVRCAGVKRSFRLGIYAGAELVEELSVAVSGYAADAIVPLATARRIDPLQVRLLDAVEFAEAGVIEFSATVVQEYLPLKEDWFAVTRLGAWRPAYSGTDGRGTDEAAARSLSDSLEAFGCLLRVNAGDTFAPVGSEPPLNKNAVFDAARRLSQCVRILRRQQIVGYAVESGNSVIWVRRYAYGLSHGLPADLLQGCGPGTEELPASALEIGQRYTVRTGKIQHRGRTYSVGQSFTPTQACTGDGTAREAEGIRARALRGGYSRRWCLSLTFSAYHPSLSSAWKPAVFADWRSPFGNRCLFDDPDAAADKVTRRHLAFGQRPLYNEEAPSGYNYLPTPLAGSGFNQSANYGASTEFFRSCQIYQPPLEILSATYETDDAGDEVVKLTLDGRLQHHHSLAPASLSRDITTWNTTYLNNESMDYATDENRLRQYLVNQYAGLPCDASGPGNASFNSTIQSAPGNPQGTCYPNALLVRLIPEPYLDGNETGEATDSPALSEHIRLVELYLRAMCEGFVDGRTSARLACENGTTTLYDFTWPNLWFSATGNRWVPLLPAAVRPDNPEGHGPTPVVGKYAATFNALVSAVNELTTVRVMLPATLEANTTTVDYTLDVTDEVRNSAGGLASVDGFSTGGSSFAVWLKTGSRPGTVSTSSSGWVSTTTATAGTGVALTADSSSAELVTSRVSVAWRWAVASGVEYALPENIRDYLEQGAAVVLSVSPSRAWDQRTVVAGEDQGTQCHATGGADTVWGTGSGSATLFVSETVLEGDFCQIYAGPIEGGEPTVGAVWASEDILGPPRPGCFGSTSRTVGLTAVNTDTPAITIPTVAYAGGS